MGHHLRLLRGGKRDGLVTRETPLDVLREAPPAAVWVSAAAGAIEHLDMQARAREVPSDAEELLYGDTGPWKTAPRRRTEDRVRRVLVSERIRKPRLRLAEVERYTPGVEAHVIELGRRYARELVLRVRDGGADESSVPIEVEVILEICSWFEMLGKLKSRAGVCGDQWPRK